MKLHNGRKGQFVYFRNELHRVYAVKPFFKKSVHLVRLKDLEQQMTQADQIELYKPRHLDSFVYNQNRYTLRNDKRAEKGDHILVMKPNPDSLDHYTLHAIEEVAAVEPYGVVTTHDNGIRHNEYSLLVPGREEEARLIDTQVTDHTEKTSIPTDEEIVSEEQGAEGPMIGDVYQKRNEEISAMVVAIQGSTVMLGGNLEVSRHELSNPEQWEYVGSLSL